MRLVWRVRSNPVARWWVLLTLVSGGNIALWVSLYRELREQPTHGQGGASDVHLML